METTNRQSWSGMLPVEDTHLAVNDSGGTGCPVIYLNGCYADQSHWRRVVDALGCEGFRNITYDERARGKSGRSADYTFEGCLRDGDAVLAARCVTQPIIVGWSYGASIAAHWAGRHSGRAAVLVLVDGAMPFGLGGEAGERQIRQLFRRMGWLLPVASRLGLAAKMSGSDHAAVNIEANRVSVDCGATLERLACPVRWVLGTGGHLGASAAIMEGGRAMLGDVIARNPHLAVSAKVPVGHSKILRHHPRAVADAIREIASAAGCRGSS